MAYLLYIDPGTGSMLFSLFIGIATAAVFGLRALFVKLKFIFSGGKTEKTASDKVLPYVIFSDHKRYWNVFKPICDEFEKRNLPLVYYTSSEDDPALTTEYKNVQTVCIGEGNKAFAKLNFLQADIVISTTPGLDVYQWKRSKGVKCYIHVPHSADELAGYRMFGLDHYDVVLATGQNQVDLVRQIENLRPAITKKDIVITGYPVFDTMKKQLESEGPVKNDKPVVLLAPSWGVSGILSRFGEKLLDSLSKTNFEIIIRPHPQTVVSEQHILKPLEEKYAGKNISWNYDNNNFEVLRKADILITDFSGIIFDYSLVFDKPVIYTSPDNFDTLPYDADWLSEERWSFKILPELGIELKEEQFESMSDIIKEALDSTGLQAGRNKAREEAWQNRGCAAQSIVDYIVKKYEEVVR